MDSKRYPNTAELVQLQGKIRKLLPKLAKEEGPGRDVFLISTGALASRTLPKARFAVEAITYWFAEGKVLQKPLPRSGVAQQGRGPLVQVFKGRGHSSRAPKSGRAMKLERDGIGLGTISK